MLVSLEWLQQFVDLSGLDPEKIGVQLTGLGLEVEGIEAVPGLDPTIVVGRITATRPHPGADRLKLCTVDVAADEPLTIVCGGANARDGLTVAVAQLGAKLPDGTKIKPAKIRGEASQGMLCSEDELGFADKSEGIWELPDDLTLGTPLEAWAQRADHIFDVALTANRGDAASYLGIARDLAAALERPLREPEAKVPEGDVPPPSIAVSDELPVARFTGFAVTGLPGNRTVSSPLWMRRRLRAAGVRALCPVVDVTNYVMLEVGQPVHAYDRSKVVGHTLRCRFAQPGEKVETLDGVTRPLERSDLVIADNDKAVGLGGVMGGANSEVSWETRELIVEAAHFTPPAVRRMSKRMGLASEASYRFERGIDIARIDRAQARVATLLQQIFGAAGHSLAFSPLAQYYPKPVTESPVAVRLDRVRRFLGSPGWTIERCQGILQRLGFQALDQTRERMLFAVPTWRHDVAREVDLLEELARVAGYDEIPCELPRLAAATVREDPFIAFRMRAKLLLAAQGGHEIVAFPFASAAAYRQLGLEEDHPLWPAVKLQNPINKDEGWMQTTLLPGLVAALSHNHRHGRRGGRLFQIGRGFFRGSPYLGDTAAPEHQLTGKAAGEERPRERYLLSFALDHPWEPKTWNDEAKGVSFFHGKAWLEQLARGFGIPQPSWQRPKTPPPFLHPGAAAEMVVGEQALGWVGELHPAVRDRASLGSHPIVVAEIDLQGLYHAHAASQGPTVEARRFPPVQRDLALVVRKQLAYGELEGAVRRFPKQRHLKDWRLFDVYEGEGLPPGTKSLAASCTFYALDRTLTDKEVDDEVGRLVRWLGQELGAELR